MSNESADARVILCRLVLDLLRLNYGFVFGGDPFASRAQDGLLVMAVFVGQSEGRPMTASKLAEYAGVPRATAVRRLAALADEGYVRRLAGGVYALEMSRFSGPLFDAMIEASARLIIRAGQSLSRMDT